LTIVVEFVRVDVALRDGVVHGMLEARFARLPTGTNPYAGGVGLAGNEARHTKACGNGDASWNTNTHCGILSTEGKHPNIRLAQESSRQLSCPASMLDNILTMQDSSSRQSKHTLDHGCGPATRAGKPD
jgi:hypothetical protein